MRWGSSANVMMTIRRWLFLSGRELWGRALMTTLMWLGTTASAVAQESLDAPFGKRDLMGIIQAGFNFGILLIVLAAAVYIAIGSYFYFAAAGNAERASEGKTILGRAITGLVVGLISWIILNTISPQFTTGLKEPSLGGQ